MLNLHKISGPAGQVQCLGGFDPLNATWVVSDVKTKLDLNRYLLGQRSFIPGNAVLRASELWRHLLTRLRPDLECVSREFALTIISEKLNGDLARDWARGPGAAQVAFDYLTQLMPILSHSSGFDSLTEWFLENPESQVRWGKWSELAFELWQSFLADGYIAQGWICGVLVNDPGLHEVWDRPLFIDLGAELNQVEADLLVHLGRYIDVRVLKPEPLWWREYSKALTPYETFQNGLVSTKSEAGESIRDLDGCSEAADEPDEPSSRQPIKYRKFTTMLAEVKDATAQVREWLEGKDISASIATDADSVRLTNIAIVAPDIELYWPALSSYLEQEDIPCQKHQVRRLHSYPDVQRWLARIRLALGSFAESDLELSLFDGGSNENRIMSFERFKILFTTLYGIEDLARSTEVSEKYVIEIQSGKRLLRDEFVAWTLKQLPPDADFKRVEALYRRLFADCSPSTLFAIQRWMAYFEQLASKIECRVKDGEPSGINCINLSAAENSPASHMIVLGLTESALRTAGGTAILTGDIMSLSAKFGFQLASEDHSKLEFEARWISESEGRSLVMTVPETDFSGAVQAASWLWVRGARQNAEHDILSLPRLTRWDSLQYMVQQNENLDLIKSERRWSATQTEYLRSSLQEDLGAKQILSFGGDLIKALSPSAIEAYLECPFVFASRYLFQVSDMPALDLEVDPATRGSLMHKIFELLTSEPFVGTRSDIELADFVEQARLECELEFADPRLWPPLKTRYVDLARRFLAFESEYRLRFPELCTREREFKVCGFLRSDTGQLVPSIEIKDQATSDTSGKYLQFRGRIDRIDEDRHGNLAIIDYKSTKNGLYQYASWLKNNKIQILLYAMAVEQGLVAIGGQHPVQAALYYSARPLNRETGFKVEDVEQGLFDTQGRSQNKISLKEKQALFLAAQNTLKEVVSNIQAGHFAPSPRDAKQCEQCSWSGLCRAPHL
jgi:RecB family exonuclease